MKEVYEKPYISKHQSSLANKFGTSPSSNTMKEIDGIAVKDLIKEFGSPLFVFSEKTIRKTIKEAYRSFTLRYPKVKFAWSYKTNYLDAICRIFHDEGSIAEVVSEYEYEMARRNGVAGKDILYNGPYKPYESLKLAVQEGAHIHIDNYDELFMLEKISDEEGRPLDVSMRLNMDTGVYPHWNRFGFNYDNGEALNAARRMYAGGKLKLTGVHSHIGTFMLDTNAYGIAVDKLVQFIKVLTNDMKFEIEYIDLGGGFPSYATLHEQYMQGKDSNPSIDQFAEVITSTLLGSGIDYDKLPTLILETGRALIDDAGYLISSVVGNKNLADGSKSIVIDAGVNVLFTSFWYKHNVYTVEEKQGLPQETLVYGPLCMNIDVVRPKVLLPSLNVGDLLVLAPVGAYNVTQWMQFIRMRPSVVLIGENGQVAKIRSEECVDTIKDLEIIPEWLK